MIGVIVAVISAVFNFAWLPCYPTWSTMVIALNVFVIWSLTAHGRDVVANWAVALSSAPDREPTRDLKHT